MMLVRRRRVFLAAVLVCAAGAGLVVFWPRNGELAYLRQFHPHEHDELEAFSPSHILDFHVPFKTMRERLDQRWGKGHEIAESEVVYHLPASFNAAGTAYLDAGTFDPDYASTKEPETWCYLTLTHYSPSWIERQIGAIRRWLRLDVNPP
jgi:hypothetical protein